MSKVIEENMSNLSVASGEASVSSSNKNYNDGIFPPKNQSQLQPSKKKRNQPGNPDPDAEVIALSPRTLLATNRFVCEICSKGFQRDQNLQLHRRGHNLPWKLKQSKKEIVRRKVYVCPESSCVHHDPLRALGDLTGIKKHFFRKHGEKKWKCDKCAKKYAVQSDWKAHSKICGTKEYKCECGTIFSRKDSFITHRAFCDALAEESCRNIHVMPFHSGSSTLLHHGNVEEQQSQFENSNELQFPIKKEQHNLRPEIPPWLSCPPVMEPVSSVFKAYNHSPDFGSSHYRLCQFTNPNSTTQPSFNLPSPHLSATALLQKAALMEVKSISNQSASPAGVFIMSRQTHTCAVDAETADFGLFSRDEFINGLTSYGNKAADLSGSAGSTGPGPLPGDISSIPLSSPSSLLHEIMMTNNPHPLSSTATFETTNLVDDDEEINFPAAVDQSGRRSNNGGLNDGTTRDFLGLRPLYQRSLTNCMNQRNTDDYRQTKPQNLCKVKSSKDL